MASTDGAHEPVVAAGELAQELEHAPAIADSSTAPANTPGNEVEMTQLPTQAAAMTNTENTQPTSDITASTTQAAVVEPVPALASSNPATRARSATADAALGPEGATLPTQQSDSPDAVLKITLMLTTGARHPYLISSKYLAARKVTAVDEQGAFDPREMSAYKLKELIWTDWRPEWEPKPRDPAAIRLIILGRMLDDKSQLKDSPFTLNEPNVVHMTVKPADLMDDEGEGAGKTIAKSLRVRSANEGESAGCCKCVIQ